MGPVFLLTSLVLAVTPGTGVLYTVAAALAGGARAGAVAALAGTLGIVPHVVAALSGLAALLHTSAVAFEVVRYAGSATCCTSPGAPCATPARCGSSPATGRPARPAGCCSTACSSTCSTPS